MECLDGDVNRMVCGMGWSGGVGLDRVMGLGEDVKSSRIVIGVKL